MCGFDYHFSWRHMGVVKRIDLEWPHLHLDSLLLYPIFLSFLFMDASTVILVADKWKFTCAMSVTTELKRLYTFSGWHEKTWTTAQSIQEWECCNYRRDTYGLCNHMTIMWQLKLLNESQFKCVTTCWELSIRIRSNYSSRTKQLTGLNLLHGPSSQIASAKLSRSRIWRWDLLTRTHATWTLTWLTPSLKIVDQVRNWRSRFKMVRYYRSLKTTKLMTKLLKPTSTRKRSTPTWFWLRRPRYQPPPQRRPLWLPLRPRLLPLPAPPRSGYLNLQ